MDIMTFLLIVLIGLIMGTIYALMGVGLSLIYGVMKIFNFAHGEFYMMGGYLLYTFSVLLNLPIIGSLILSMVVVFVFGAFVERVLLRDLYTKKIENPHQFAIITTLGLSMVLIHSCLLIFGPYPKLLPDYVSGVYSISKLYIHGNRLFAFGVTLLIIITLFIFLKKTWIGRALQAVAQSKIGASVVGIDIPKFNNLAYALSSMMAAGAGALLAPLFYLIPTIGAVPFTKGWVIIVLGGMGSFIGSLLGGLFLGVIEVIGIVVIGPSYRDSYGFIALIIVLLLRPSGLMGEKVRKA